MKWVSSRAETKFKKAVNSMRNLPTRLLAHSALLYRQAHDRPAPRRGDSRHASAIYPNTRSLAHHWFASHDRRRKERAELRSGRSNGFSDDNSDRGSIGMLGGGFLFRKQASIYTQKALENDKYALIFRASLTRGQENYILFLIISKLPAGVGQLMRTHSRRVKDTEALIYRAQIQLRDGQVGRIRRQTCKTAIQNRS